MNQVETAHVLGILGVEYRNEVIDQPRIELWAELFRDVAFEDAKVAVLEWFRDAERGRFFPRPAELRSLVRGRQAALALGSRSSAGNGAASDGRPMVYSRFDPVLDAYVRLEESEPYDDVKHGPAVRVALFAEAERLHGAATGGELVSIGRRAS